MIGDHDRGRKLLALQPRLLCRKRLKPGLQRLVQRQLDDRRMWTGRNFGFRHMRRKFRKFHPRDGHELGLGLLGLGE